MQTALLKGYEVRAAVRPSSDISGLKSIKGTDKQPLTFVFPDYNSLDSLISFLEKGDYQYIIHAAGLTRAKTKEAYDVVNADYSLNLAKAAIASQIPLKRFVFMSSLAALGPIQYADKQPINELSQPNPVTSYGASKLKAEQYLNQVSGLPLTIMRPTAVFGPGEKDIFIVFKTLNKGLDLYIGNAPQRLSFIYVKDLVEATFAAMKQDTVDKKVYNISDGQQYSRYELADLFKDLSGRKSYRVHLPVSLIRIVASVLETVSVFSKKAPVLNSEKIQELTAENWYCSIDYAVKDLIFRPEYNLRKGLAETLDWYKSNNWL